MISSNFDKGNAFDLITLKKEAKTTDTLLNELFKDNKQIDNSKIEIKNAFTDPQALLSKYAKLATESSNLGSINPNQMNFPIGG